MPQINNNRESRQDWLDWLRATAILLVLGSHYQIDWWDAGLFRPFAQFNMRIGWSGVDMFFVISGFLIGGLLINEQRKYGCVDLKRFYLRRAAKIWPLLYAVPLVYIIFFYRFSGFDRYSVALEFIPTLFHAQNFFYLPMGHLWSLAVEEHFYLILPVLIFTVSQTSSEAKLPLRLISLFFIIIISVIIIRVTAVYIYNVKPGTIRVQTQYRFDSLLMGVSLAWIYNYKPEIWNKIQNSNVTTLLGVLCAWPFALNPNHSLILASIGLSFLSMFYCSLVFTIMRFKNRLQDINMANYLLLALAWIGRRSYAIYLFHPFIWLIMVKFKIVEFSKSSPFMLQTFIWIIGYIVFVGLSILIGAIVSSIAERPLLALRNKVIPAKSRALIQ